MCIRDRLRPTLQLPSTSRGYNPICFSASYSAFRQLCFQKPIKINRKTGSDYIKGQYLKLNKEYEKLLEKKEYY